MSGFRTFDLFSLGEDLQSEVKFQEWFEDVKLHKNKCFFKFISNT